MPDKTRITPSGTGPTTFYDYRETSVKTPNFHTRKALGLELPVNSYDFWYSHFNGTRVRKNDGYYFSDHDWLGLYNINSLLNGSPFGPARPAFSNLELDKSRDAFLSLLREKIRGEVANLPVVLAEFPKTAGTIAGIITDVYRGMRDVVRGEPLSGLRRIFFGSNIEPSARGLSRGVANRWLEWSFAIKPTYQDAVALATGLQRDFADPRSRCYSVKSKSSRVFTGFTKTTGLTWYSANANATVTWDAEVVCEVDNPQTAAASVYHFDDPASLAWELIPFSFVLDWFVPIGDYLASLRDVKGVSVKRGWYTQKTVGDVTTFCNLRDANVDKKTSGYRTLLYLKRAPVPSIPPPYFPGWSPRFGATQVAHSLALIRNFIDDAR